MKYFAENARFDFGDDDSGIFWEARVTVDLENDCIHDYNVTHVHVGGKVVPFAHVDSELKDRIYRIMDNLEMSDLSS